jgi:ATP-dependent Clp protease ATP-binding subunit ClpA
VFEGYTHEARQALVVALEEARALRSDAIATGHLLIGVIRSLPLLVPLRADDVRARLGTGGAAEDAGLPFTDAAKRVLQDAPLEAQRLGHGRVTPAHLLLALAADPEAVELSSLDPARLRDEALRHLIQAPERFDLERALGEGGAVPVWLGDRELPIGDLGHPRVDARLLLAILGKEGRSAELLREHGLDEAAVRAALGGP